MNIKVMETCIFYCSQIGNICTASHMMFCKLMYEILTLSKVCYQVSYCFLFFLQLLHLYRAPAEPSPQITVFSYLSFNDYVIFSFLFTSQTTTFGTWINFLSPCYSTWHILNVTWTIVPAVSYVWTTFLTRLKISH